MSASATENRPWPERSLATRVGPALAVVVVLVGLAVVGTVHGRREPLVVDRGPSLAEMRGYVRQPDLPITYEEAKKAGTVDRYDWGEHCDTERQNGDTGTTLARIAVPSIYAPPCVPAWNGKKPWVSQGGQRFTKNGGVTAPGVTAETIKVVFYEPADQDVAKQLEQLGVFDGPDATFDTVRDQIEMSNHLFETYGRRVELVRFQASGDGRSPSAAQADAVRVAELGAFASIGGPNQTGAYQHELARHEILCLQCGFASTDDVLAADAPYVWGHQATPDQILFGTFELGTKLFSGAKAAFAGDPALRTKTRRYGVVHYEQDPPVFGPLKAAAIDRYATPGVSLGPVISYQLDPNSLNAQAQAIVGRLKRDGVTSVVFIGDPLMPRLLTQQATRQNYRPEWIFTGTVFTDTTAIARLYDQSQMAHAFGASSNPARTVPEASEGWRLHRWWFGTAPAHPRSTLIWGPIVQDLFLGIHMAGPHLKAETFAGGLFRYPPSGGVNTAGQDTASLFLGGYLAGDTTPEISWGFHTDPTRADFVAIDDFTSVWWDADAKGPDEDGVQGKGLWKYLGSGLRISLANPAAPGGTTQAFYFNDTIDEVGGPLADAAAALGQPKLPVSSGILTDVPPLDRTPDYPIRKDAPAVKRKGGG